MLKVVPMKLATADKAAALAIIDQLRAEIESGRYVGFIGVTIADNDETAAWCATLKPITRLRMQGAVSSLLLSEFA